MGSLKGWESVISVTSISRAAHQEDGGAAHGRGGGFIVRGKIRPAQCLVPTACCPTDSSSLCSTCTGLSCS